MGILGGAQPQPGGPLSPSLFRSDSVLGRMARGGYQPTEADLEELQKLARDGNRAERRAAARHLKKQGMAAPAAAPRMPVFTPAVAVTATEQTSVKPALPARVHATKELPAKKEPARKEPAKPVPTLELVPPAKAPAKAPKEKVAVRKVAARKPAAAKAPAKRIAAKTAAPGKRAPSRSAKSKPAVKKTAGKTVSKKVAAKKSPAKTRRSK